MTRIIVMGIDPGALAGLVALDVDAERPSDISSWSWLSATVIRKPSRVAMTGAEERIEAAKLACDWMATIGRRGLLTRVSEIDQVAIERPADMGNYGAEGKRGQRTSTSFAIGESYGALLVAAKSAGARRVFDYAVREWMPKTKTGDFTHVQRKLDTLKQLGAVIESLTRCPLDEVTGDENVVMAFGVLYHHLMR